MRPDRRRDAATAATGTVLVGGGAELRRAGVNRAVNASGKPHPRWHPSAFIRNAPGRRMYGAGVASGLVGVTGMGVGLHELTRSRPRVQQPAAATEPLIKYQTAHQRADNAVDFARQGISGTTDAMRERVENTRNPQSSARARAMVAGAGLATGGLSSLATKHALSGMKHGARLTPATSAVVGTAAGVASLPLTNRIAHRHGYEVTPTGVRRTKSAPARPTRQAKVVETRAGRGRMQHTRSQIVPSDSRVGKAKIKYSSRVQWDGKAKAKIIDAHRKGKNIGYSHTSVRDEEGKKIRPRAVSTLYVKPKWRGRGIGSEIGRRTLKQQEGHKLRTMPAAIRQADGSESTGPSTPQLRDWYGRSGFKMESNDVTMARPARVAKYYGEDMSGPRKRAMVMAAGAAPVIGPYAAAAQAARTAPPEQKRSAAATQLGSYGAGASLGAAGGAHAAVRYARTPKGAKRIDAANVKINRVRTVAGEKLPGILGRAAAPATKPGFASRKVSQLATHKGPVGAFMRPLAERPGAAALGALGGKAVGSGTLGFAGYSAILRRERKRNAQIGKSLPTSQTGMNRREQREQLKRKRRNLGISMAATGVGATGVGILATRELGPRLPVAGKHIAAHAKPLERAGIATALTGGGVGAYQGVAGAKIQRKDLAAQEKVLASKAAGQPRQAGMRASNIAMRRNARMPGVMVPVRRANSVAKYDAGQMRFAENVMAEYARLSKSEISPGVFKPIGSLRPKERRLLATHVDDNRVIRRAFGGTPLLERGTRPADNQKNRIFSSFKNAPTTPSTRRNVHFADVPSRQRAAIERSLPKKVRRPVVFHAATPGDDEQGAMTFGRAGTRRASHVFLGAENNDATIRHEFEHSQPKRSWDRIARVQSQTHTRAREEARADSNTVRARNPSERIGSDYELTSSLRQQGKAGNKIAASMVSSLKQHGADNPEFDHHYTAMRARLGQPVRGAKSLPEGRVWDSVRSAEPKKRRFGIFGKLDTTMSNRTAHQVKAQYGLKGPLPKTLTRDQKMHAYEGRYVAAGGKKGERWQRHADRLDKVTGGALAVGGVGALGQLHREIRGPARITAATHPVVRVADRIAGHGGKIGLGAGGAGAISELAHRHAQHKANSYRSSPAGVAASALTRMRSYTPDD